MRLDSIQGPLKEALEKKRLNTVEGGKAIGISYATISRILNGKVATVDDHTGELILRWLGRPIDYTMRPSAPSTVREDNGILADKLFSLSVWIRQHPESWPFILNAARGCGYKDPT